MKVLNLVYVCLVGSLFVPSCFLSEKLTKQFEFYVCGLSSCKIFVRNRSQKGPKNALRAVQIFVLGASGPSLKMLLL